jgi:hypothetical protein
VIRRRRDEGRGELRVWLIAIPALLWGIQLHLFEMLSIVWFRFPELREVWLTRVGWWPSYFQANVAIAAALAVLSAMHLMQVARRTPRRSSELLAGIAVLVFVIGFGFRLAYFRTHYLEAERFAGDAESVDSKRFLLGLIVGIDPPRVLLETCEEVAIELPRSGAASELVVVEEFRTRFTDARLLEVVEYYEYDDLCTVLSDYVRDLPSAECLKQPCR